MPFTITNKTEATIPFRDDAGKRFIEPGWAVLLVGDQHAPAATAAGLAVVWVQSHRDIILAALAEDAKAAKVEPVKPSGTDVTQTAKPAKPKPKD